MKDRGRGVVRRERGLEAGRGESDRRGHPPRLK